MVVAQVDLLLPIENAPIQDSRHENVAADADTSSQIISVHSSDSEDSHALMLEKLAVFRHTSLSRGRSTAARSPSLGQQPGRSSGSSVEIEKSDSSHAVQTTENAVEKPSKPAKRKRPVTIPSISGITDLQLSRLDHCVSCELRWTARKSVPEKVKHVVTCARKKGFDNETIAAMVEKALRSTPVKPKETAQNLLKGDTSPAKTLLASVQADVVCKKRGRKAIISNTVQDPSRLRPAILGRARDFLDDREPALTSEGPLRYVATSRSMLDNPGPEVPVTSSMLDPPLTQAFGKSRLAALRPTGTSILTASPPQASSTNPHTSTGVTSESARLEFAYPPTTQAFAPSTLAQNRSGSRNTSPSLSSHYVSPPQLLREVAPLVAVEPTENLVHSASAGGGDSIIIIQHSSSPVVFCDEPNQSLDAPDSRLISSVSTSFPETHDMLGQPAVESPVSERAMNNSPWDRNRVHETSRDVDDAYLHWEPPPSPPHIPTAEVDLPSQNRRELDLAAVVNAGNELPAAPKPKSSKRKSKKDFSAEKPVDHPDFEQKMLIRIQSDEALWLRILRYEVQSPFHLILLLLNGPAH